MEIAIDDGSLWPELVEYIDGKVGSVALWHSDSRKNSSYALKIKDNKRPQAKTKI